MTAQDSPIPLGTAAAQVLLSEESIEEAALQLML